MTYPPYAYDSIDPDRETVSGINSRLYAEFSRLYPEHADHTDGIVIEHHDDETITVDIEGIRTWVAEIDSDHDDYLYFHLDGDEDRILCVKVRVFGAD